MAAPSEAADTAPPTFNPTSISSQTFDYVVVGGGTAGLVVASRLSENPNIRVAVLEAGPSALDEPLINIPGRFGESIGTEYDWKFETVPQGGIQGRKLAWPRGRVLGGTSALNFMTWNRGCREDYDAWERLGNQGWGWEGLLPLFKKSEKIHVPPAQSQTDDSLYLNPECHGTSGPIDTTYSAEFAASHQHWHSTLNSLGVGTNKNHFAGSNVGCWTSLTSVDPKTRTRCYSAKAYYQPVQSRENLTVFTEAVVRELIVEDVDGELAATGAKFSYAQALHQITASREVILCAGSVQSPILLELSGIGSPSILQAAGITVKFANTHVGENLQDHMMTATIYEISPEITTPDDLRASDDLHASAMRSYNTSASGPLTQIPSSICYLPFSAVMSSSTFAKMHSLLPPPPSSTDPLSLLRHKILRSRFQPEANLGQIEYNFDTSNYSLYFVAEPGKKYATMLQMLQYPFSVGSVHIAASTDGNKTTILDEPVIDPRYYQGEGGEADFKAMVESQAFGHKIVSTSPLASLIVKRVFPPLAADNIQDDVTDYVRNYTVTDWHPVGTCAMAPFNPGDKDEEAREESFGGVVDARLRVYGVKRLRVVDASIMPLQVSAHIQATVYAIAEKGATLILEDYEADAKATL